MKGKEKEVKECLENPDEIRRSKLDKTVYLFYRMINEMRWICVITKRLNSEGFLITAYPTEYGADKSLL